MVDAVTVVLALEVLFAGFESAVAALTAAVSVEVPALFSVSTMVPVTVAPAVTVPRLNVFDAAPVPWLPWENFLQSGGTVEQVAVNLVTSPEFNQTQAGPTNDTWLDAFYNDALGRAVDASGRSTWDTAFADSATRAQVAASIFTSTEYHQDLVKQYYNQFLDRVVDGSGYPAWTGVLNSGIHDELVIASIVSSPEFFDKTSA